MAEPKKRNFKILHRNPSEDQKKGYHLFADRIVTRCKFFGLKFYQCGPHAHEFNMSEVEDRTLET